MSKPKRIKVTGLQTQSVEIEITTSELLKTLKHEVYLAIRDKDPHPGVRADEYYVTKEGVLMGYIDHGRNDEERYPVQGVSFDSPYHKTVQAIATLTQFLS